MFCEESSRKSEYNFQVTRAMNTDCRETKGKYTERVMDAGLGVVEGGGTIETLIHVEKV